MENEEQNSPGHVHGVAHDARPVRDKTCLSYWFPKLQAAGLPVPRTTIVEMSDAAFRDVFRVFDGENMTGDSQPFFEALRSAADEIGYPCFLRTGQTSGKHDWERTCFVTEAKAIAQHVVNLIEFSECVQLVGLPCNVWAVREFLPTMPLGVCAYYRNMPVCREFRFFVNGGEIECQHPYWPQDSLEQGGAGDCYEELCKVSDPGPLRKLARAVGLAVGGRWSVDILETSRGWYVTDMAEADRSYHWEGCQFDKSGEAGHNRSGEADGSVPHSPDSLSDHGV